MKVQQIYTGCLAEAAIVDPLRETAPYLEMAKQDGGFH